MIRRVGIERFNLLAIFDGAELGDIEFSVRLQFGAQRIVDADMRNGHASEFGMLGEEGAHEQTAVAGAFDGEFAGLSVAGVDEVFSASGEVVEDILLFGQVAGLVPFLTELAAAAQVGDDINAALIEPDATGDTKIG